MEKLVTTSTTIKPVVLSPGPVKRLNLLTFCIVLAFTTMMSFRSVSGFATHCTCCFASAKLFVMYLKHWGSVKCRLCNVLFHNIVVFRGRKPLRISKIWLWMTKCAFFPKLNVKISDEDEDGIFRSYLNKSSTEYFPNTTKENAPA